MLDLSAMKTTYLFLFFSSILLACGGGESDRLDELPSLNRMSGVLTKKHAQLITGMFELDGMQGLNVTDNLPKKFKTNELLEEDLEGYNDTCELVSKSGNLDDQDQDGIPGSYETSYRCSKCGLDEIPCSRMASVRDFNENDWRDGHFFKFIQIYEANIKTPLFHLVEVNRESEAVYVIKKKTSICGNTSVKCLADIAFRIEAGYAKAEDCGFDDPDTHKGSIEESLGFKGAVKDINGLIEFQASNEDSVILSVTSNELRYACFSISEGEIVFTDQNGNTLTMARNQAEQEGYYSFLFNGERVKALRY